MKHKAAAVVTAAGLAIGLTTLGSSAAFADSSWAASGSGGTCSATGYDKPSQSLVESSSCSYVQADITFIYGGTTTTYVGPKSYASSYVNSATTMVTDRYGTIWIGATSATDHF